MMVWIILIMLIMSLVMMNKSLEMMLILYITIILLLKCYFVEFQFESNYFYIDSLSISMMSLCMILLCLSISISQLNENKSKKFLCFLSGFLALVMFQSNNLLLLFIVFEGSLIPLMILLMGWGKQPERLVAGQFIMFYTLICSFPLLCFISFSEEVEGIFSMFNMLINNNYKDNFWMTEMSSIIFISMTMTFLMKVPMFMIHSWLPKAHVEAPLEGSIILAGIMLKVGIYGIFRIINMIPMNYTKLLPMIFSISLIGSVITLWMAISSDDVKLSIALSSVSHMNFLLCSLMSMKELSVNFSCMMMISHGLISSMLFFFVTIIYEQINSRSIMLSKGLMSSSPSISLSCFILFSLSVSIPPSISFTSELMMISSIINYSLISSVCIMTFIMINSFYNMMNFGIFFHSAMMKKNFSFMNPSLLFNLFSLVSSIMLIISFFFIEAV